MNTNFLFALLITLVFFSCKKENTGGEDSTVNYTSDFNQGTENWKQFFSDYPVGEEVLFELEYGHSNLPAPLDSTIKALKISGHNRSDDLLCAVYRKFDGLEPNKTYSVTFDIDFASNALLNGVGIGGSPDLPIGAGGIDFEPKNTVIDNFYRPNFDSKLQADLSNEVFQILGTIGVSEISPTPFMLISRNNLNTPIALTSNSNGEIYILIATDSSYEGLTTLYFKSIKVNFE